MPVTSEKLKYSMKYWSYVWHLGIDLRGDSGSGHFLILPNLTNFGRFLPNMCQNHEKLAIFAEKWQFFKFFGAFGAGADIEGGYGLSDGG